MVKLPRVSGKELLRFLEREGFSVISVRGSHHVLSNGVLDTVVPVTAIAPRLLARCARYFATWSSPPKISRTD